MNPLDLWNYRSNLTLDHADIIEIWFLFKVQIDLGAESTLAAERDQEKIAAEIKSCVAESDISKFHTALGQYLNYCRFSTGDKAMDKRQRYSQIIHQLLTENAEPHTHSDNVEAEVICDTQNDHYQLTYAGWNGQRRVFGVVLHSDIKGSKIWIQYNGTELPIGKILTERLIVEL
jgi:XisI protein/XisH protein